MTATDQHSPSPNVLFILADQWRAEALGCYGNRQVATPALDRLAAEGALIERMYATDPVCTPARAAIITGRYPHTTGTVRNNLQLPPEEIGFAEVLTGRGYACGYIGKWHLDGEERPGFVPPGPRRQGFDAYWAGFNRGHRYWDSIYYLDTPQPIQVRGRYEPEYQTDLAIDFIRRQASAGQPFCLFLAWGPPHTPLNPPDEFQRRYPPESIELAPNVPAAEADEARRQLSGYFGHCTALDAQCARLLETLDSLGIAGNTVVLFTADHGDLIGNHGLYRKGQPFDEASRIPMLWRWPGSAGRTGTGEAASGGTLGAARGERTGIPAGTRPPLVATHVDLAPTILGLCGAPIPAGVQGTDLSPWLTGQSAAAPPQVGYIEGRIGRDGGRPEWRAVRTMDHLLAIEFPDDSSLAVTHLYDVTADPYQLRNLAGDPGAASLQRELLDLLFREAHRTGDPRPELAPGRA